MKRIVSVLLAIAMVVPTMLTPTVAAEEEGAANPTPTLISVTPKYLPERDITRVRLGASLEEISAALEVSTVQVTLEDPAGNRYTKEVGFILQAEDNPHYDPAAATPAVYRLNARLLFDGPVNDPQGLGLWVVVQTQQYEILSFESVVRSGAVGTPIEELGLPDSIHVRRGDNQYEIMDVIWDLSAYDPAKTGRQLIDGTLPPFRRI